LKDVLYDFRFNLFITSNGAMIDELLLTIFASAVLFRAVEFLEKNLNVAEVGGHYFQDGRRHRSLRKHPFSPAVYISGVCMVFRTKVLKQIGGFDSNIIMGCEDVDVSIRVQKAGWKIAMLPETSGVHLGSQTVKKFGAKSQTYILASRLYILRKNFSLKETLRHLFFMLVLDIKTALLHLSQKDPSYMWNKTKEYVDFLRCFRTPIS